MPLGRATSDTVTTAGGKNQGRRYRPNPSLPTIFEDEGAAAMQEFYKVTIGQFAKLSIQDEGADDDRRHNNNHGEHRPQPVVRFPSATRLSPSRTRSPSISPTTAPTTRRIVRNKFAKALVFHRLRKITKHRTRSARDTPTSAPAPLKG
jgi:hypothetical protein